MYQGRWLDFLLVDYFREACEDPSIVYAWQPSICPDLTLNALQAANCFFSRIEIPIPTERIVYNPTDVHGNCVECRGHMWMIAAPDVAACVYLTCM